MAYEKFLTVTWTFFFVFTLVFAQFPDTMEKVTGVQSNDFSGTNISSVNADTGNITDESQSQLDTVYNIYTGTDSSNRVLQAFFGLTVLITLIIVIDLGWIG